ncbi:hypothetical protein DSO57_1010563 [Entomophthora muscae]|uniref:Uncharacterized protein n=1 Tax=Entomophthora muscae TaxID=34485 RepID=A0ACC2THY9_9FUNG|nr:hypothetical protein DSO57_1010563 [Entomophthora muscae]
MPLPVLVNLNLRSSLHSCDQCNQRRRRCDRKMPSCSQCAFREVGCSYKRQLKRCQVLSPQNTTCMPLTVATSDLVVIPFQTPASKRDKDLKLSGQQVRMGAADAAGILAAQWPYTASSFIDHLRGRGGVYEQPIYVAKACLAPILDAGVIWTKPHHEIPFACFKIQPLAGSTIKRHLDRALEAYFAHVNPFSPIFVRRCFFSRARSERVMVAVWLSGMLHLSDVDPATLSILKARFIELGKLSTLRPSLDTLQFLLVVLVGMRGYPILGSTARLCHNLALRLATCLGLHLNLGIRCPVLALERRLASNMAISFDATRGWGLRLPYLRSNDYARPASSYTLLAHYDDAARLHPASGNTSWDKGCLQFSNYLFETCAPVYDTHLLYGRIERGESVSIKSDCSALTQRVQDISLDQTRQLYQNAGIGCDYTTEAYVNAGFMFTRILCYAIASLVPMAQSSHAPNHVALDWAIQAISASLQMPATLPVFEGRIFLTTVALSFILRAHAAASSNSIDMFIKGYKHLLSFKTHKGFRSHVNDNLAILDTLLKEKNLTHLVN